ncbi:MAG: TlyA family RNA methyltransferase [Coriobacteriia bacterium]|nr:TlyA family RNA methyltransferase [Coriobacteriia bacterium]
MSKKPTPDKVPLNELLVKQGHFADEAQAERAILAGVVFSDGTALVQPRLLVAVDVPLTIEPKKRFVSRGGEKLAAALGAFELSAEGLRCIDIGASTGGFTDCLLQHGAAKVCAVDVGYGQFAWELRENNRVRLFERTNIKKVMPAELGAPFDLAVIDVSFTRLSRLIETLEALLGQKAYCIALIKPQFELPKSLVIGGVVREKAHHAQAIEMVLAALAPSTLAARGLIFSPIKGQKGNIEYILLIQKDANDATISTKEVVEAAHAQLT